MTPNGTAYKSLAAYARLSRRSDGTLESTGLQNEVMQTHADRNGNTITAWFADPHLSAWDESVHRPGWEAYLEALASGAHDGALSYHFDRLARNGTDAERLLKVTKDRDLPLITPEQVLDLGSNADARMVFRIQAAVAINASDATSRRSRNHKDGARRRGLLRTVYGGTPPLGFRQGRDDWEVHPAQRDYLAGAAERVLAGEPVDAAHRALGPMADSAGRTVSIKMLRAALTRPASAGLITERDGTVSGRAPAGGPLDEQTFNRLQVLFGARRRGRPAKTDASGAARYPLGPLLRCGKCGNMLTGEVVRTRNGGGLPRDYYRCANPHKALGITRPCKGCSVPAEDVHALVKDAVMAWASTPAARQAAAQAPDTTGRRAELEARIAEAQDHLANLIEKRMRGHIRPDLYVRLEAVATAQIDAGAAELAGLDKLDAEPGVPVVLDHWDELTAAEQRRVVAEALVTPIVVEPGNGGGAARSAAERIELVPR
jgi:DNA invertase Pin-like site-specific DNA recombinase